MRCPFCNDGDSGYTPGALLLHVGDNHRDRMYEPVKEKAEPIPVAIWPKFSGSFPGVDIDAVHRRVA